MFPLRVNLRRLHAPIVTIVLILVNAVVFFHEISLPHAVLDRFLDTYGLVPAHYLAALTHAPTRLDLWLVPLFASMFIHGGWLHIGGNMLYLWVFGSILEGRMGRVRFLVFYLLAGLLAAHTQVLLTPTSTLPMIGASGAISGVMGGFLLVFPLARVEVLILIVIIPIFFELPAILFLGIWALQQFLYGAMFALSRTAARGSDIAVWAHAGGFVTGMLLVLPFLGRRQRSHLRAHYRHPLAQWHGDRGV